METHHTITGAGEVRLHAVEAGNPDGRPILFIHGFSQCWLAWDRQLNSELANDFRLVAMDLRGHGLSDKPEAAYAESRCWADDVDAVIRTLDLDRPVLCGWSYGPLVILDYLRHHGEEAIGGINVVGGVTRLGSDEAASVLTPEFLGLMPGFFSSDVTESVAALDALLSLCFTRDFSPTDRYLMMGCSAFVPPHVREALFSRSLDNDDLLPALRRPALITHGVDDGVVKPTVIDEQWSGIRSSEIRMIENAGHACFWDQPDAYNRRLREFVGAL